MFWTPRWKNLCCVLFAINNSYNTRQNFKRTSVNKLELNHNEVNTSLLRESPGLHEEARGWTFNSKSAIKRLYILIQFLPIKTTQGRHHLYLTDGRTVTHKTWSRPKLIRIKVRVLEHSCGSKALIFLFFFLILHS